MALTKIVTSFGSSAVPPQSGVLGPAAFASWSTQLLQRPSTFATPIMMHAIRLARKKNQ